MSNKKKWIAGGVAAWVTFNLVWMYKDDTFTRISEMNERHNGKIPFTWENADYIFNNHIR